MTMRRMLAAALTAITWCGALNAFTPALATTERDLVAEGFAQAFSVRASADYGGAEKLPFFFGSYADATLTNPPAAADGQASWYNLGIAETAVFSPQGECTRQEQQRRLQEATTDVTGWVTGVVVPTIRDDLMNREPNVPVLPLPTLPCTERLPGFSQSRYPATDRISSSSSHDLLGEALCRAGACAVSDALAPLTGGILEGGRFVATATGEPSQNSDAMMAGIHVPGVLDIGVARSVATASLDGKRLITQATWTATDICVVPGAAGCALSIDSIRQVARVERDADGKVLHREERTVIVGVSGGGQAKEVTLGPGFPPVDLGRNLQIRAISSTGDCGDPASDGVADAGGLEIVGEGGGGPSLPPLPLPIVGSATGGGVLLGGACASGRISAVSFELPGQIPPEEFNIPGRTIVTPPGPLPPASQTMSKPLLSEPRVVTKDTVRYVFRTAPAWRTAKYWASVLGALLLAIALGYVFRRSRPIAPVASAIDRFARQFVRG